MNNIELAKEWRDQQSEANRKNSGVVLIWDSSVYGWKNELRDAGDERPGAIAVDCDGHQFRAEAGNDQGGALGWVAL
jgi:hypothetical protein